MSCACAESQYMLDCIRSSLPGLANVHCYMVHCNYGTPLHWKHCIGLALLPRELSYWQLFWLCGPMQCQRVHLIYCAFMFHRLKNTTSPLLTPSTQSSPLHTWFSSCNAQRQSFSPFVLLGVCGGCQRTGCGYGTQHGAPWICFNQVFKTKVHRHVTV